MGLDNMAPNDLAHLMNVGGAALCSLLMVVFKSLDALRSLFCGGCGSVTELCLMNLMKRLLLMRMIIII